VRGDSPAARRKVSALIVGITQHTLEYNSA
jgi:hypothetical protein